MRKKSDFTSKCGRCRLSKSRKKVVYGRGNLQAYLVFVGEAPGRSEDDIGKPFVGKAGEVLNQLIEGVGYKRKDVFITNTCLCRPPNNRKPFASEVLACRPRLIKSLRRIGRVVILLGHSASRAVIKADNIAWGVPYYVKEIKKVCVPIKHPSWYLYGNMKFFSFGVIELKDGIVNAEKILRWRSEEKRRKLCKTS
jgi:uracil-DNA glycosylase family 4